MILTEPGRAVSDRITLLGRLESCVALLDGGAECALLGGGLTYITPDVMSQIDALELDPATIRRLVILHSHFDHVGIVPHAKHRWPWAVITGSSRARDLLATPKVAESIAGLNQATTARVGCSEAVDVLPDAYAPITVEQTADDGDVITCGDLTLEVIAVPGHSSCSIAVYVPELKALFPSDAGGIRHQDFFLAAGNSNFDQYQQSLEKLSHYDVEVVVMEHYGALTGDDARTYIARSQQEAARTRILLEETYHRTGDVQQAAEAVTDVFVAASPENFLPREILIIVATQMVRYIAKTHGSTS